MLGTCCRRLYAEHTCFQEQLVKIASIGARDREQQIKSVMRTIMEVTEPNLKQWGLQLCASSLEIIGHVLPPPQLTLTGQDGQESGIKVEDGVWNMQNKQWLKSSTLRSWDVVSFISTSECRPQDPLMEIVDKFRIDYARARQAPATIREANLEDDQLQEVLQCGERVLEKTEHNPEVLLCIWPHGTRIEPHGRNPPQESSMHGTELLHLVLPSGFNYEEALAKLADELKQLHLVGKLTYWGVICFASEQEMESCVMSSRHRKRYQRPLEQLLKQMKTTGLAASSLHPPAWVCAQPEPHDAEAVCSILESCGKGVVEATTPPLKFCCACSQMIRRHLCTALSSSPRRFFCHHAMLNRPSQLNAWSCPHSKRRLDFRAKEAKVAKEAKEAKQAKVGESIVATLLM